MKAHPHAKPASVSAPAQIFGWGAVTGARSIAIAEAEREFGLPHGKIGKGAGIVHLARVNGHEDECVLAARACEEALHTAHARVSDVDCLIASSETHTGFPSLGPLLHVRLRAEPETMVLDVGGGCIGVVNALAMAQALIATGTHRRVLIATADVHSRRLTPQRVPGEFGALFGDGASAFLLGPEDSVSGAHYRLGAFLFGNDPSAIAAIRIGLNDGVRFDVTFEGTDLSRAAVARLQRLVRDLEHKSGVDHRTAAAFATHQPNPRLVNLLARQLHVSPEKFPPVAKKYGNLGASTCGMALSLALTQSANLPESRRGPIFVAALGPGLLWGGTVLSYGQDKDGNE